MNQNDRLYRHRLSWEESYPDLEDVTAALEYAGDYYPAEAAAILGSEPHSWHNRQRHMGKLSTAFPKTVFTLDVTPEAQDAPTGEAGLDTPAPFREYYRNGLVQAAGSLNPPGFNPDEFNPDELTKTQGVGTQGTGKLQETPIPDNIYRCGGLDSGFPDLEAIHFTDGRNDEEQPDELYYAELLDEEYQTWAAGFFCTWCLRAAGLEAQDRPTLQEEIDRRSQAGPSREEGGGPDSCGAVLGCTRETSVVLETPGGGYFGKVCGPHADQLNRYLEAMMEVNRTLAQGSSINSREIPVFADFMSQAA